MNDVPPTCASYDWKQGASSESLVDVGDEVFVVEGPYFNNKGRVDELYTPYGMAYVIFECHLALTNPPRHTVPCNKLRLIVKNARPDNTEKAA